MPHQDDIDHVLLEHHPPIMTIHKTWKNIGNVVCHVRGFHPVDVLCLDLGLDLDLDLGLGLGLGLGPGLDLDLDPDLWIVMSVRRVIICGLHLTMIVIDPNKSWKMHQYHRSHTSFIFF
jgi:hypothetical protein